MKQLYELVSIAIFQNTGGSQFFLVRQLQPHLDGQHTVFGKIILGFELIDKLQVGDVITKVVIKDNSPIIANHRLITI